MEMRFRKWTDTWTWCVRSFCTWIANEGACHNVDIINVCAWCYAVNWAQSVREGEDSLSTWTVNCVGNMKFRLRLVIPTDTELKQAETGTQMEQEQEEEHNSWLVSTTASVTSLYLFPTFLVVCRHHVHTVYIYFVPTVQLSSCSSVYLWLMRTKADLVIVYLSA